ncbi:HAD family hydrolase [Aestuariibaculum suncheonense]|uniref:HAD family phosphatase n=1 Tax=Aestuariibaculum suncheonense TaxID=1028745 RepID=A0A8J6QVV1_9FLAO|nr:HAD family phosphatase [Aestuariibaculum suncheonense]MBD0835959.1 HAD family phosphatase [Aestuariibaculum suncheonense]
MIKTLIFDFGNVFINLDIEGNLKHALEKFKIDAFSEEMLAFNSFYEQGLISTEELIEFYSDNFPHLSNEELVDIWNYMLKDFPKHRLEFLQRLKEEERYNLILLSNTNDLHIDWIKKHVPFFEDFKTCFNQFYLSHEIQLRKPNQDIFEFVLSQNNLKANECVFIDDNTDNCKTAEALGIKTWNINPEAEDVTTLFKTKANLF